MATQEHLYSFRQSYVIKGFDSFHINFELVRDFYQSQVKLAGSN